MSVFSSACSCTPVIWKLSIMQDFFQDNAFWHHYNQTQTWFDLYPFVVSIVKVMVITIFQLYFCPFRKSDIKQEMFQKHVCPPWCKIQVYLLCRSKTCTKQVTKGLKYIKWTTHWAQKSSLTLTFEHVTWKSIGIIYSLRATPVPSMVLIKWRGKKIFTRQHSGLRRVVWPWPLNMWPENQ